MVPGEPSCTKLSEEGSQNDEHKSDMVIIPEDSISNILNDDEFRLYAAYPSLPNLSAAHTIGRVVLEDRMCFDELVKVLCDTGALSANYIAKDLIDKLKSKIKKDSFFKTKCRVTLADNRTVKDISTGVRLKLVVKDQDQKKYAYTGDFFILDMAKNDIILGLPALTGKLYPFMEKLLQKAHEEQEDLPTPGYEDPELNALDLETDIDESIVLENPWINSASEIAPEDYETELPVNFGEALTFLGKSREEAIQDYHAMLDSHVSPEMKENTDIIHYLRKEALPVFVPEEWTGIKGIPPLKVKWRDTLPQRMKPKARPINPKLWEASEKEFRRLCGYFYGASRSPWASCLVVAPKATPPYIRFCGDYVQINKHMEVGNYTIPNVKHELAKIINFPMYLDIDLTNAFHQILLHPETSEKLSLQTPWGQYEPKFMPEGVAPATGILQEVVKDIFEECEEWAIVIFDNMLILARDAADGFMKFKRIVEIALEKNLKLKMAKTWLGFRKVDFFGYVCRHKSFEVSPDKKEALAQIPMPDTYKKARSLLGKGVFFSGFTPNYSDLVAHLTDMTKKTFSWDKATWKHDYEAEFKAFIAGLQASCELFYPDYTLEWILRTDASELGVGAVLLQRKVLPGSKVQLQPIAFIAKKFSDPATRWSTIEQEGFGIYYAVKQLAYYLVGKEFVVETDHNNLLWMESSLVPKIIRWRIYLQSFNFLLRHIRGKDNEIADWMSRLHHFYHHVSHSTDTADATESEISGQPLKLPNTPLEALEAVHNSKVGHMGERVTWLRLNKIFPGHGISFKQVTEFVAACPNCNKTRLGMKGVLAPIVRTLKPPEMRSAIGIDALEVTPHSPEGYTHINVIVNLFTKLVSLHPVKGVTALNLANSVWKHWCYYGHTDIVISDQGPDLTSGLFEQLTEYMGMRHAFSIADEHSNGSERIIGEVVRHLRAMVYDSSSKSAQRDIFADSSWIDSVQYILNSEVSAETGHSPFELTFGSDAVPYMEMAQGQLKSQPHARLSKLNATLLELKTKSTAFQQNLIQTRFESGPMAEEQNMYQPGDYVLFDKGAKVHPKMAHRYAGPFEVKHQVKNDVTCQQMATGEVVTYDVRRLKLYSGNHAQAYDMARRDKDQHVIERIISFKGDRHKRTSMVFTVLFADGDVREIPYSQDIYNSIPYEDFCRSKPYLRHLLHTAVEMPEFLRQLRRDYPLGKFRLKQEVFMDVRLHGDIWFDSLNLPDTSTMTYVSRFVVTRITQAKLDLLNPITKEHFKFGVHDLFCFLHLEFDPSSMVLIDEAFLVNYPQVKDS